MDEVYWATAAKKRLRDFLFILICLLLQYALVLGIAACDMPFADVFYQVESFQQYLRVEPCCLMQNGLPLLISPRVPGLVTPLIVTWYPPLGFIL